MVPSKMSMEGALWGLMEAYVQKQHKHISWVEHVQGKLKERDYSRSCEKIS